MSQENVEIFERGVGCGVRKPDRVRGSVPLELASALPCELRGPTTTTSTTPRRRSGRLGVHSASPGARWAGLWPHEVGARSTGSNSGSKVGETQRNSKHLRAGQTNPAARQPPSEPGRLKLTKSGRYAQVWLGAERRACVPLVDGAWQAALPIPIGDRLCAHAGRSSSWRGASHQHARRRGSRASFAPIDAYRHRER
jgi:hypothetical protein